MSAICDVATQSLSLSLCHNRSIALNYVIAICKNLLSFETDLLTGIMLHTFGMPLSPSSDSCSPPVAMGDSVSISIPFASGAPFIGREGEEGASGV